VSFSFSYLPYRETNAFSPLAIDYLSASDRLKPFYRFDTDAEGMSAAIRERSKHQPDRALLVEVLKAQYAGLTMHPAVTRNLDLLQHEHTFTVCTAHQPNLMTGYLYFIYKIVHAIKLAAELKTRFPQQDFVPVYYMGSEDNDLEELGTFRYNNRKFVWDGGGQKGAVGRMSTDSLKPLLDELFKVLGPPGPHCEALREMIEQAYLKHDTIGKATQYLVNELFGAYGLLVLDPDDHRLKSAFIKIMEDDLLHQTAHGIVTRQMEQLSEHYKVQAHPRPINLFYLKDDIRERIEQRGDQWAVVHTDIRWDRQAVLRELSEHPERFSPNVILRGLFQETILPNVAFIGGGAEVAYWLQLHALFMHYGVFYPSVHLRQSVLWVGQKENALRTQLGLELPDLFKPENELVHAFVLKQGHDEWQTDKEIQMLEQTLHTLKQKAVKLDPTLRASAEAALAKMRYQVAVLEKKMLRAEKRNMHDQLARIAKLKSHLFPGGGLQERVENFISFYLLHGTDFIDTLQLAMEPFRHEFMIVEEV
jgi:bacillithiol synthase